MPCCTTTGFFFTVTSLDISRDTLRWPALTGQVDRGSRASPTIEGERRATESDEKREARLRRTLERASRF